MKGSLRTQLLVSMVAVLGAVVVTTWLVGASVLETPNDREALLSVLGLAVVLAFGLAFILAEYLARVIGGPIQEMTQAADALRQGDFSQRVRSRRRDELGALGSAIDQMADQLVDRIEASRREEGRLRTILDAMVEGVFVTDPDGRIVLTNAALVELAGRQVVGATPVEVIRSADLHDAVRGALDGTSSAVTFDTTISGDKRTFEAQVTSLTVADQPGGVVAVLHDVTNLKRADAVRRDFVANASHELRTPLTAIVGFSETLRDGALEDPRMARRFVTSISDNAARLRRLVDDLLELSRAESPDAGYDLGPVPVEMVAAKVLRDLERRAQDKNQELRLESVAGPTHAHADAQALDQVLLNLVDNAVKYTHEGGRIIVRVREGKGHVFLEVEDNGPGIPRAQTDRIFERFYRLDRGRARSHGGTGLGLSIVRHLVGRLGGDVTVETRLGQGTTFRVTLGRSEAPEPEQDALAAED